MTGKVQQTLRRYACAPCAMMAQFFYVKRCLQSHGQALSLSYHWRLNFSCYASPVQKHYFLATIGWLPHGTFAHWVINNKTALQDRQRRNKRSADTCENCIRKNMVKNLFTYAPFHLAFLFIRHASAAIYVTAEASPVLLFFSTAVPVLFCSMLLWVSCSHFVVYLHVKSDRINA